MPPGFGFCLCRAKCKNICARTTNEFSLMFWLDLTLGYDLAGKIDDFGKNIFFLFQKRGIDRVHCTRKPETLNTTANIFSTHRF